MAVMVFAMAAAAEATDRASAPLARAIRPADHLIEEPPIIAVAIAHGVVDIAMTAMVDIAVDIVTDIATAIGSAADIVTVATGDIGTAATGGITTAITIMATFMDSGLTDRASRRLHSAS